MNHLILHADSSTAGDRAGQRGAGHPEGTYCQCKMLILLFIIGNCLHLPLMQVLTKRDEILGKAPG